MIRARVWTTVAVIACAIAGCSDDINSDKTAQPDSVTVTPATVSLTIGQSQDAVAAFKLGATALPDAVGVWTSNNPAVVALDPAATGLSATLIALEGGTATVTVSDGPASASVQVTVAAATPTRLDISPAQVAVPLGGIVPIHVGAVYPDGTETEVTDQVTWASDAAAIATATGSQVTGVAKGTANLTATFGGQTATVPVTVGDPAPHTLAIASTTTPFTVAVGATIAFTATQTATDNTTSDVTTTGTWTSATTANATIGAHTGIATGVKAGTSVIEIVNGALTAQVTLTVTAAP